MNVNLETATIKLGDTIGGLIFDSLTVTGVITAFGEHKGQPVVDIIDQSGLPRFLYLGQIDQFNKAYKAGLIEANIFG